MKRLRSQIWYQPGYYSENQDKEYYGRLRILTHDKAEYCANNWPKGDFQRCCWDGCDNPSCCPERIGVEGRIRAMHKYDRDEGYPKAIFIGYT